MPAYSIPHPPDSFRDPRSQPELALRLSIDIAATPLRRTRSPHTATSPQRPPAFPQLMGIGGYTVGIKLILPLKLMA